jgi:hypothetical protein
LLSLDKINGELMKNREIMKKRFKSGTNTRNV